MLFDEEPATLELKAALSLLSRIVPKNTTLPILRCIRVHGEGVTSTLEATDLDTYARIRVPYASGKDTVLPLDEFRRLSALRLPLESDYVLEDWPHMESRDPKSVKLAPGWLEAALHVLPCASDDRTRLSLNGVYLHESGAVATDGYRLRLVPGEHDQGWPECIIPTRFLETLSKIKGMPVGWVHGSKFYAEYPWGVVATYKLIEGAYPKYHRAVPRSTAWTAKIHGLPELRIAASNVKSGRLMFLKSGTVLESWSVATQREKAVHFATYPLQMSLEPVCGEVPEFGVDARYLLEMAGACGGLATVSGNTAIQALLFDVEKPGTRLLMPLRLD